MRIVTVLTWFNWLSIQFYYVWVSKALLRTKSNYEIFPSKAFVNSKTGFEENANKTTISLFKASDSEPSTTVTAVPQMVLKGRTKLREKIGRKENLMRNVVKSSAENTLDNFLDYILSDKNYYKNKRIKSSPKFKESKFNKGYLLYVARLSQNN